MYIYPFDPEWDCCTCEFVEDWEGKMKVYVFNEKQMKDIKIWLEGAKIVLDTENPLKILGAQAAIDNAIKILDSEEGE